jgi:UDP-glucose 4-epimerase
MSRALVTGGAGFIGSNLTKALVSEGWSVDVVDNMTNGSIESLTGLDIKCFLGGIVDLYEDQIAKKQLIRPQAQVWVIEDDFTSEAINRRIKNGSYDVVFHQAAVPRVSYSVENPALTTDENLLKSVQLLEVCKGNVKRVVIASSSSVYGGSEEMPTSEAVPKNPKSPYALQKSCLEDFSKMFCSLYDMDIVLLRYFNVFGPGQLGGSPYATAVAAWCNAIVDGNSLRSDGDGSQTRDMCYVDNVVSANIKAATANRRFSAECYNVCCGDQVSNLEILDFMKHRFAGIQIKHAPWRAGDVMHTRGDWSAANRDFGYEPIVKFWDGLEKTLAWWGLNN